MADSGDKLTAKTENYSVSSKIGDNVHLEWNLEGVEKMDFKMRKIFPIDSSDATSSGNMIKLNIGGQIFQTTKSTLTKFDGFLKAILESGIPTEKDDSGCIFIDRDAKHFRSILNYLRDGDIDFPDSEKELREILKEAQFYQLEGLIEMCSEILEPGTRDFQKLKFIENDDQFLQIITEPTKPVFIFHYGSMDHGKYVYPFNLNIQEFLKKYKDIFDIYFKAQQPNGEKMFWKWSIHDYNKYHEGKDGWKYEVREEIDADIKHFIENNPFP